MSTWRPCLRETRATCLDGPVANTRVGLRNLIWAATVGIACVGCLALGTWQVHRRAWKEDLIARVNARVNAPPVAVPPRSQWPRLHRADDEYRRLCLDGVFLDARTSLVQAVTRLGPGFWVLTPLQMADGNYVLINRGFVSPEERGAVAQAFKQPSGAGQVCGLLRWSEPRGAFLHRNDPAREAWYSRDVAAIAVARGLPASSVAPFFVDADATDNPGGWPVGGLTVIHFPNNHALYAITWYALALIIAAGTGLALWKEKRQAAP